MRTQEHQGEDIPYLADFDTTPAERVSPEDEEDFPVIKKAFIVIKQAEKKANSMDTLREGHEELTTDQLMVAYQFALDEVITPIRESLMDTIGEVKLKQRGVISND